jgi:hypothetical protein
MRKSKDRQHTDQRSTYAYKTIEMLPGLSISRRVRVMVFNATSNHVSAISWRLTISKTSRILNLRIKCRIAKYRIIHLQLIVSERNNNDI